MVTRRTVGTGITARVMTVAEGPDEIAAAFRRLAKRGRPTFERQIAEAVAWAHDVLPTDQRPGGVRAHDPVEPDSLEDFAFRILRLVALVRSAIAGSRADEAARFAFQLGALCQALEMKEELEPAADVGKRQLAGLAETRDKASAAKRRVARKRHSEWQDRADAVWKLHPTWSPSHVAKKIEQPGEDWNYIRQVIRKSK